MSSGLRARVIVVIFVTGLLAAPVAGVQLEGLAQESVDPDTVVLQAELQDDGDAQWAVVYRTRLDDDNTTAAFEALQADIEENESGYTSQFGERMNRTIGAAENATDREMTMRNLTVSAEIETLPQEYGVVTYRFDWTNFAVSEGGRLRAGDALAGLFLDSESTLRMGWPEGYERTSVSPAPDRSDATSVAWDGRQDFGSDQPTLVVTATGTTAVQQEPDGDGSAWLLLVATVLAGAGVVAILWANRRYGWTDGSASVADDGPDGAGADADADPEQAVAPGTTGGDAESDDTAEANEEYATPPPELLSNEERVLQLLDDSGGRLKQQQIVERLDWTAAKTSQVISGLREEDELETFRIGRENVVTLPDVDIASDLGADGDDESNGKHEE